MLPTFTDGNFSDFPYIQYLTRKLKVNRKKNQKIFTQKRGTL